MKDIPDHLYVEIAFDEVQRAYERQLVSIDTIKASVRSYLGAASWLISLGGALQIFAMDVSAAWWQVSRFGLLAAGVVYILLVSLCAYALFPVKFFSPVLLEWDTLTTAYKALSEKEAILQRMSNYLNAIDLNRSLIAKMHRLSVAIGVLLPLMVLIFVLLAMIPRG